MSDDVELFKKTLGKRVARLRKEKGYTQAELSALINIDFQSISRIENGKINPSAYLILQIANALEVEVGEFFVR
ncbi:MAG: helix-turn-helix transcriptional regulator [Pedobacter sp.]|nr:helix-turn-helix transcriptional regulator [Pedobacter sp.]